MDLAGLDARRELALILACARVAPRAPDDIARDLRPDLDWTALLSMAGRHGVLPVVHAALEGHPGIPSAARAHLARHAARNAERNRRLLSAQRAVLRALSARALETVPLRSAWLGSPVHEVVDVDLLVREADVLPAERIVTGLGFRPLIAMSPAELAVVRRTGWARRFVDAHGTTVSVQWAALPRALHHGARLPRLWGDGHGDGRPGRGLAAAALLQIVALRGTVSRWHRLLWIRELALLLARSSAEDLAAAVAGARASGGLRALRLGTLLASTLLGAPADAVADDASRDAVAVALAEETIAELARPGRRLPGPADIARYQRRARERRRDRVAYVVRRIAVPTPEDAQAVPLPPALTRFLSVVRPARLAAAAWRVRRSRLWKHPGQMVRFGGTPPHVVDRMLALAAVTAADTLCDVGCGDGRIVIHAATRTGCRALGIDVDPALVAAARRRAREAGVQGRVQFVCADVRTVDLTGATVVTLYLNAAANLAVRPLLLAQLRPGARIVSRNFDMADWLPDATEVLEEGAWGSETLYLWRLAAPPAGATETAAAVRAS